MSMMINKNIAGILGMDIPEETTATEVVPVEPHEIVQIDNSSLPQMHDLDRKQLQAEKQLEEMLGHFMGYSQELYEFIGTVEPKYKARYVEVMNQSGGLAMDALKLKMGYLEERRKQRLKEAEFVGKPKKTDSSTTNNFFIGTREELLDAMEELEPTIINDDKTVDVSLSDEET